MKIEEISYTIVQLVLFYLSLFSGNIKTIITSLSCVKLIEIIGMRFGIKSKNREQPKRQSRRNKNSKRIIKLTLLLHIQYLLSFL